jgi:tRNA modification GTPase
LSVEVSRDYFDDSTIVAQASGSGGALTVVRSSGPDAFIALKALSGKENIQPRTAHRVMLRSPKDGSVIDDAVVVYFPATSSFTGEEQVEYYLHANSYIVYKLISILISSFRFKQALPGEFSFRAVRAGKMSLLQAQSLLDVLSANNEVALAMSLEKLRGERGDVIQNLDSKLERLLILTEAGIDFSDQDIEEVSLKSLKNEMVEIQIYLKSLSEGYERGRRIQDGINCAFLGVPNAGKSSLFNSLLNEERAIVTEIPGTTRDLISEKITLFNSDKTHSVSVNLIDTAGIRKSDDRVESIGINRSIKAFKDSDIVLVLVDPCQSLTVQVLELLQFFDSEDSIEKAIFVFTKSDQIDSKSRSKIEAEFFKGFTAPSSCKKESVWVSSVESSGINSLIEIICKKSMKWLNRNPGEIFLTRVEQIQAINNALKIINEALQVHEHDLFASMVRQLNFALSPITGKRSTDEILGGIFSGFCIGK